MDSKYKYAVHTHVLLEIEEKKIIKHNYNF